jgi:hypothetical protein
MVPLYTISQKSFKSRVRCEVKSPPPGGDVEIVQFSRELAQGGWEEMTNLAPHELHRDDKNDAHNDMQPNWFSDGGICSNFPIHFFDSWLPRRPTFGVNLTTQLARGVPQEQAGRGAEVRDEKLREERRELVKERSAVPVVRDEFESGGSGTRVQTQRGYGEDVYLPLPNEVLPPEWIPIDGFGKFLETIFRTAQNYRDNMQAMLPSYRERIVQIRLTDQEGGLNLDMDKETIKRVVEKGEAAGEKLCDKFVLEKHQWVRFRVLMKQMETQLAELNRGIRANPIYTDIMDKEKRFDTKDYPYVPLDEQWLPNIITRLETIGAVIKGFDSDDLFAADPHPMPDPVLRVTPQI